jgi:hypothetical protein
MSLTTIFAAFEPLLVAAFEPLLPSTVKFVGPERKDDQSTAPRISWHPKRERHLPPKELGIVLVRECAIEVEIWGDDLAQTEELLGKFLAVTHDLCSRFSYSFGSGEWITGGVSASGCIHRLNLLLQIPVPKTELPSRPVTAFTATHTMGNTQV